MSEVKQLFSKVLTYPLELFGIFCILKIIASKKLKISLETPAGSIDKSSYLTTFIFLGNNF